VDEPGAGSGGSTSRPNVPAASTFLIPVTGFAPGRVTVLELSTRPVHQATSLTLEIPVLGVKTSIVGVPSVGGKWDVSWLQDQVGWLHGTAYPTWKGNSVLTAHVTNADGKPGVFSTLKALGVGEYVFVVHSGYRYTYKVVSNAFVQPNDASVMKHEEKSFLTLITCDTYDEKTGTYLRRVAVRLVLVDVSER
jgi:LPXTG-site transpeptidase (sortase) family protein